MDYTKIDRKFYDRVNELNFLEKRLAGLERGELGVLYGRRRMGKTELLKKFISGATAKSIYINIVSDNKTDLKKALSAKIEQVFKETVKIGQWEDFFEYLNHKSRTEKLLFVIDEFQRLDKFAKGFIFSLQNSWDNFLKHNKLMLIVSGSSMRMMHRLALEEKGPLYGRATFSYHLKQFRYADLRYMFKEKSEEEKIDIFSVFGGTPKYLSDFKLSNKNTIAALNQLVLSENGPLFDEPINALKFELKNPERYVSILRAISMGKVELKEIAGFLGLDNAEITPYLRNLSTLLDIIESDDPLFGKKRMKRYKIKDNFFRFWYRFVYPHREQIAAGIYDPVTKKIEKELNTYKGKIFEDIVREFFLIMNGKKIKGKRIDFTEYGKWWENAEDIDLVLSSKSKTVFVEAKFQEKKMSSACFEDLKRKSNKTSASGRFEYCIVSKSGFEQELIDRKVHNLLLLSLPEIASILDGLSESETNKQLDLARWGIRKST